MMSTLYITQQGAVLGKTSERLTLKVDKDVVAEMPLIKVSQVVVFGHVLITSGTLNMLMRHGIEVCYLTQYGGYVGRTEPELSKNGILRLDQYRAAVEPKRRIGLARSVVAGKLANLRVILLEKVPKDAKTEAKQVVKQIKSAEKGAQRAKRLEQVRAYEGTGSAAYFSAFGLEQYEQRRATEFMHPALKRTMTYQQSFEQQARQLAKTLQGELEEYPPLCM